MNPTQAEDFGKYCLLGLLVLPFVALAADALGKTRGMMLRVAACVVVASWAMVFLVGGFEKRPYVAALFVLAWLSWPLVTLVAKVWNPRLSWLSLWASVLLMSWYHVTMAILFYGERGLGAGMALFLAWSYMIPPFALLNLAFLTAREMVRIIVELRSGGVREIALRDRKE